MIGKTEIIEIDMSCAGVVREIAKRTVGRVEGETSQVQHLELQAVTFHAKRLGLAYLLFL